MKKWILEDWAFEVTVLEGQAKHCRIGMEQGDQFIFQYATPADFCPRAMAELYTYCEVIRCGGDFTYRGCPEKYEMELWCPCQCIHFRLKAIPINQDAHRNNIGSP